jgi:hypothetical protein
MPQKDHRTLVVMYSEHSIGRRLKKSQETIREFYDLTGLTCWVRTAVAGSGAVAA